MLPTWATSRFRRGDRVPADLPQKLWDYIRSLRVDVAWPLVKDPSTGTITIDGTYRTMRFARVTGAPIDGGRYPWVELVDDGAGNLVDGPRSGSAVSDPAIELNSNMDVGMIRFECWRDPKNNLRFRASQCP